MQKFSVINLIRFLNLLLAVMVVWWLGKLSMGYWDAQNSTFSLAMPELAYQSDSIPSSSVVLTGNLFGKPEKSAAIQPKEEQFIQEELQETKLSLKLKGVVTTPGKSIALIQKGSQVLVLAPGEEVSRGVSIDQVAENFVVINNRGILEKLLLPGIEMRSAGKVSQKPTLAKAQLAKLDEVKKQVKKSPISISRYVRVRSIKKEGKIIALQLWPRTEKEIFTALGFKSGDRVKGINGQSIEQLSASPASWQKLLNETRLSFDIQRNGVMQTLDVNLQ